MDALRARDIFCFKIHGGPMTMAGVPDIMACVREPFTNLGVFVGIETKMPGSHPTPVQLHRHNQIRASGGVVIVAHSVREALDGIGVITGTDPG
jgi:hypothetical protein